MPLPPAPYGVDIVQKFGRNPDVDTAGVPADIWSYTGAYSFPSSAQATTIQSDNAADASAGTGAQIVIVQGLDSAYMLQTVSATMNGVTPVALSVDFLRVFRAYVDTPGTNETNVGNITVQHGATVLAQIDAGAGQTLMGIYTIPADYEKAFITRAFISIGKSAVSAYAAINLEFKPFGGAWRIISTYDPNINGSSTIIEDWPDGLRIPAKADLRLRCVLASANDLIISGRFDVQLYRKAD